VLEGVKEEGDRVIVCGAGRVYEEGLKVIVGELLILKILFSVRLNRLLNLRKKIL
jgi:hypothetical protein